MSGAIWLASYPKSGNTWARLALRSLLSQGAAIDLTDITQFGKMVIGRRLFDQAMEFDGSHLSIEEIEELRPALHDFLCEQEDARPQLIKVHDKWFRNRSGRPVFDANHSSSAIYILRDPRDVAVSWARFAARTIDWTIGYLANPAARLTSNRRHIDTNIPQRIGDWSGHVTSWVDDSGLVPLVIRYEDMHTDLPATLARIAAHLDWSATAEAIAGAVAATRFDRLADQERRHGFSEMPDSATRFFVSGRVGGWRDTLSVEQAARIEQDHRVVMERFGYL